MITTPLSASKPNAVQLFPPPPLSLPSPCATATAAPITHAATLQCIHPSSLARTAPPITRALAACILVTCQRNTRDLKRRGSLSRPTEIRRLSQTTQRCLVETYAVKKTRSQREHVQSTARPKSGPMQGDIGGTRNSSGASGCEPSAAAFLCPPPHSLFTKKNV